MSPKSKVRKKPPHRDPRAQARKASVEAAKNSTRRKWGLAVVALIGVMVFGVFAVVDRGGDEADVETAAPTTLPVATTATTATTATPTTIGAQGLPVSVPVPAKGASIVGDTPCPNADGSSPRTTAFTKAPPTCIVASKKYVAEMQTSKGLVTLALDAQAAPMTVNNFVVLARYHFFDTLPFHRIVPGFVIQGGSVDASGNGGPGYRFADEVPTAGAYKVGSLAMANSGANTNGSQFFVVAGSPEQLQPLYSLFGEVTGGLDVVLAISTAGSRGGGPDAGKPTEVVTIQTVTIKEI